MTPFSLNNFIKICLLDTGGRISEIQKKLESSGGYDFYNSFQRATRAKLKGKSDAHVMSILNAPAKQAERQYNIETYNKVQAKFGSIKSIEALSNKKKLKFGVAGIEVLVDPLFQIEKSGAIKVYSVWPTQKPELTQRYGALACHLMREAFKSTSLGNAQFHFYDAVKDKTYSEKQINNNTSLILKSDLSSISNMLKEL